MLPATPDFFGSEAAVFECGRLEADSVSARIFTTHLEAAPVSIALESDPEKGTRTPDRTEFPTRLTASSGPLHCRCAFQRRLELSSVRGACAVGQVLAI